MFENARRFRLRDGVLAQRDRAAAAPHTVLGIVWRWRAIVLCQLRSKPHCAFTSHCRLHSTLLT